MHQWALPTHSCEMFCGRNSPEFHQNKQVVNMFEVELMSSGRRTKQQKLAGDLLRGALRAAHAPGAEQPGWRKRHERGRLGEGITEEEMF